MELLAVKWGCMSEEEKAMYYDKAVRVKEAYFSKVRSLYMYRVVQKNEATLLYSF